MSGAFSEEWLAIRQGWDLAARATEVEGAARQWLATRKTDAVPIRILDLGAGTGNNQRHLAAVFPAPCDWVLVDHDPALLAAAERDAALRDGDRLETRQIDLAEVDFGALFAGVDLVTASALLDLVSDEWLARFLDALAESGAGLLAVLTYDGRIDVEEGGEDVENIRTLFNAHQHRDKGFGPALGPAALLHVEDGLEARGYALTTGISDWVLQAGDPGARELVTGWTRAAGEIAPLDREEILAWGEALLTMPERRISVGHRDVFAAP